ncbi:5-hydroxyisourate hydrolase-like [Polymixia lowei]
MTLSTRVLNPGHGAPVVRVALSLHRLDSNLLIWNLLTVGWVQIPARDYITLQLQMSDTYGCHPGLITREAVTPGMCKLRFETGQYWESMGQTSFYPYVEVVSSITNPSRRFHLPLVMNRFSYSTCRGS